MTYRELLMELTKLNDAQLDSEAWVSDESYSAPVIDVDILEEDQIDPSGDGMEPVSTYANDPDYADETIVARKGDVLLIAVARQSHD